MDPSLPFEVLCAANNPLLRSTGHGVSNSSRVRRNATPCDPWFMTAFVSACREISVPGVNSDSGFDRTLEYGLGGLSPRLEQARVHRSHPLSTGPNSPPNP